MRISIHQPEHMPWLGFFYKMKHSDTFVILDSVQYRKNYFQNRNQILLYNRPTWITVPVETKGHTSKTIRDMMIANSNIKWKETYLSRIKEAYSHYPNFDLHYPHIESIIKSDIPSLEFLNIIIIEYLRKYLSITTPILYSYDMDLPTHKADLVLDICKELNADEYLAGISGRDYLNLEDFKKENISVVYNEYNKFEYHQKSRATYDFIPYLSILDLIMYYTEKDANIIIDNSFSLEK